MNKKPIFKRKETWIVISIVVVAILVVVLVLVLKPHNSANLSISVAPADAKITIDGNDYTNGLYREMAPGQYTATISKDGFEEKTVNLELKNDEVTRISEYLKQLEQGLDYYETDSNSLLALREYADTHEDAEVKKFLEEHDRKLRIKEILSIEYEEELTGDFYVVDYLENSPGCVKSFCLTVNASSDAYVETAFSVLKIHGYDAKDYEIVNISDGCD